MSWFSKKLKKVTKVLDPVGAKLRKSTGGSYGDPMNWYQSKPNETIPYQQRTSQGLMAAPPGGPPPGMTFGQNTGGRNYIQNQFAGGGGGGMMMGGVQGGAPMPGGPPPPPAVGMNGPRDAMAQQQMQPPQMQPPQQIPPQMQQQMARIGAIRGSYV